MTDDLEHLAQSMRHHNHLKQFALGMAGAALLIVLLASSLS